MIKNLGMPNTSNKRTIISILLLFFEDLLIASQSGGISSAYISIVGVKSVTDIREAKIKLDLTIFSKLVIDDMHMDLKQFSKFHRLNAVNIGSFQLTLISGVIFSHLPISDKNSSFSQHNFRQGFMSQTQALIWIGTATFKGNDPRHFIFLLTSEAYVDGIMK
ncbi:hypothetical protein FF38_05608 [Lucilia cuprina]|uniref:Uncharacterized protein n=1 Tax=Lucilia cuprina TaxID=7375 RepID=A0A0L0BV02_LUCCU|nr:hypothetical protein FF38_05608 [Lucilia cuprina]